MIRQACRELLRDALSDHPRADLLAEQILDHLDEKDCAIVPREPSEMMLYRAHGFAIIPVARQLWKVMVSSAERD